MARGGKRAGAGRKPNPHKENQARAPRAPEAPRSYEPEVAYQAKKLCELGATDLELADFFGVSVSTVYRWKIEFAEFSEALRSGKEAADDRVERSLYNRAVGYSYDSVKVFNDKGKALIVPFREHVPPDTSAAFIWLQNRRKDKWRSKVDHELTGKDGGPIEVADARERLAGRIAGVAARIGTSKPPGGTE